MVVAAVLAGILGSCLQRISGAGVGLVVTPVMALIFGPVSGVLLTNCVTIVSAATIMSLVWRNVDWKRFFHLGPISLVGSVVGAILVGSMSQGVLQIVVGAVVLGALILTFAVPKVPESSGVTPGFVAGTAGGFLNTVAGVSMPAMVIYSQVTRWPQLRFAATMQPLFLLFGIFSVGTKLVMGTAEWGELPPWWFFVLVACSIFVGVAVGTGLARVVSSSKARMVAVVVAGVGAVSTIVRGVSLL